MSCLGNAFVFFVFSVFVFFCFFIFGSFFVFVFRFSLVFYNLCSLSPSFWVSFYFFFLKIPKKTISDFCVFFLFLYFSFLLIYFLFPRSPIKFLSHEEDAVSKIEQENKKKTEKQKGFTFFFLLFLPLCFYLFFILFLFSTFCPFFSFLIVFSLFFLLFLVRFHLFSSSLLFTSPLSFHLLFSPFSLLFFFVFNFFQFILFVDVSPYVNAPLIQKTDGGMDLLQYRGIIWEPYKKGGEGKRNKKPTR